MTKRKKNLKIELKKLGKEVYKKLTSNGHKVEYLDDRKHITVYGSNTFENDIVYKNIDNLCIIYKTGEIIDLSMFASGIDEDDYIEIEDFTKTYYDKIQQESEDNNISYFNNKEKVNTFLEDKNYLRSLYNELCYCNVNDDDYYSDEYLGEGVYRSDLKEFKTIIKER